MSDALRHNGYVYDSTEEYIERSVGLLREGLEAGEGAVVANARPGLAAMREALGIDAARVKFSTSRRPTRAPRARWPPIARCTSDELRSVGSLRAVADVQLGP